MSSAQDSHLIVPELIRISQKSTDPQTLISLFVSFPLVQFTFERLGKADTTEYDSEYQSLCDELDKIKLATERLIQFTAYMLEPNPSEWDTNTQS